MVHFHQNFSIFSKSPKHYPKNIGYPRGNVEKGQCRHAGNAQIVLNTFWVDLCVAICFYRLFDDEKFGEIAVSQ